MSSEKLDLANFSGTTKVVLYNVKLDKIIGYTGSAEQQKTGTAIDNETEYDTYVFTLTKNGTGLDATFTLKNTNNYGIYYNGSKVFSWSNSQLSDLTYTQYGYIKAGTAYMAHDGSSIGYYGSGYMTSNYQ